MSELTQEALKSLLRYNPETGVFVWLVDRRGGARVGDIAGTIGDRGYITIYVNRARYRAHRLAWFYHYGVFPTQLDHINRDRADNRIANLREVTSSQNAKNRGLNKKNKTGVNGVRFCPVRKKYRADIRVNYKTIYLGLFVKIEDAKAARAKADIDYGFSASHGCKEVNHDK